MLILIKKGLFMKDRIALITGGIGDIGTAICHEFIDNGAKVIAVDRVDNTKAQQWQAKQKEQGYDVGYVQVDVTHYDNCVKMAADVCQPLKLDGVPGVLVYLRRRRKSGCDMRK